MKIGKPSLSIIATFAIGFSSNAVAVQPLEITEAFVDDSGASRELVVLGENFNNGGDVELWLGAHLLAVLSQDNAMIVADLPAGIPDGSYQLVASSGGGAVRYDDFDGVTIGGTGPAGPAGADGVDGMDGEPGPAGADGTNGMDGAPGADGADGMDGAPGQPGADGADGTSCSVNQVGETIMIDCTDGTSALLDISSLQERVFGSCPPESSIRAIHLDGSVTCEMDTDTQYLAGFGMNQVGNTFHVDDLQFQRRIVGACPPGHAIREIHSDGSLTCISILDP